MLTPETSRKLLRRFSRIMDRGLKGKFMKDLLPAETYPDVKSFALGPFGSVKVMKDKTLPAGYYKMTKDTIYAAEDVYEGIKEMFTERKEKKA